MTADEHRRLVLDTLSEGVIVWDGRGHAIDCNETAARLLGLEIAELLDRPLADLIGSVAPGLRPVDPDGTPLTYDEYPPIAAFEQGHFVEGHLCEIHRSDGSLVWLEIDIRVCPEERTGSRIIVASFRDVSGRVAADSRLRFQAHLLETVGQAIVATDAVGTVTYWNAAAEHLYGWTADEARGRDIRDLVWEPSTRSAADALDEPLRRGESWRGDVVQRRQDGSRVPVLLSLTPLLDPAGALTGVIGVSTDITGRQATEERNRVLSAIVASSGESITSGDLDGLVTSWNQGATDLYGYSSDEMVGRSASCVVPPDRLDEFDAVLAAVGRGDTVRDFETIRQRRDGRPVEVSLTASPVRDATGEVAGISVIAREVSALVRARRDVVVSEARFRSLVQQSADVAFVTDARGGCITYASPAVAQFGYHPDQLVGLPSASLVHPDDLHHADALWQEIDHCGSATVEWRLRTGDRGWCWVEQVLTDLRHVPEVDGVVSNVRDITARRQADEERLVAESRFQTGFQRSAFGLAITDLERRLTEVNPALCHLLQSTAAELRGRRLDEFLHPDDTGMAGHPFDQILPYGGADQRRGEVRMVRRDGSPAWVMIDDALIRDPDGAPSYYFTQLRDTTDRRRIEDELAHRALHDELTNLPNRVLFVDRLAQAISRCERTNTIAAVLFLDLDRFKLVNDGLGHAIGDELLARFAARLAAEVRPSDTVARFGGDEFALICEDVAGEAAAVEIAERLAEAFETPFAVFERELYATVSIGVAMATAASTPEQVLRDADTAMYRAKERGRARVELFNAELRDRVNARIDVEGALRRALKREELEIAYQPVVRLRDGLLVGVEALARWNRPGRGLVTPDEFIPMAEETGLIGQLGRWVLDRALSDIRAVQRETPDAADLGVSVNLSAFQLRLPTSVDVVRSAIAATGIAPETVQLEITETAVMAEVDVSIAMLEAMKSLGVRLAVDDFGTGYSSLSYLKQLPIDILKIDRSFVDGLPVDPYDRSIAQAIIAMGHALGLTVLAEGVETLEQRSALDAMGCELGQGFLWGKPMDLHALRGVIRAEPRVRAARAAALA